MRALFEFSCPACGPIEEFADHAEPTVPCPCCGQVATRRYSVPLLDRAGTFGKPITLHTPDRRVSNLAAEQHEHWQRTRYGDLAGPITSLNEKFKPTIFS